MSTISSIALSGMQAASLRLGAAAHNVANASTPSFHRQQVVQRAGATGGVEASVTQAGHAGAQLEADLVDQKAALYTFKANLRMVQTEHHMLGALLDTQA